MRAKSTSLKGPEYVLTLTSGLVKCKARMTGAWFVPFRLASVLLWFFFQSRRCGTPCAWKQSPARSVQRKAPHNPASRGEKAPRTHVHMFLPIPPFLHAFCAPEQIPQYALTRAFARRECRCLGALGRAAAWCLGPQRTSQVTASSESEKEVHKIEDTRSITSQKYRLAPPRFTRAK